MRSDTEDKDMKGYNGWSYAPYRPYFFNVGDIYVCPIAPSENAIHIEWLGEGEKEYGVFFKKRDEESFINAGSTKLC